MKMKKLGALALTTTLVFGRFSQVVAAKIRARQRTERKIYRYLSLQMTMSHQSTRGMIEKYKEAHSDTIGNIDVQITTQEEYSKTFDRYDDGKGAAWIYSIWDRESVQQFVENGYIENIQPILTELGISTDDLVAQEALNSYRYDGSKVGTGDLYALPKDASVFAYAYNKDLFDKEGIPYPDPENPYTYDEFVEVCKQFTKDTDGDGEIDQWGCGLANQFMIQQYIWSNGATFLSDDYKTVKLTHLSLKRHSRSLLT